MVQEVRDNGKGGRKVGGECSAKMWNAEVGGRDIRGKCSGEVTKVRGV